MAQRSRHFWALVIIAALAATVGALALRGALLWHGHRFAGILLDPDGIASSYGMPWWEGIRSDLRFPDRVVAIDGVLLDGSADYRAQAWDQEIERAAREGQSRVQIRVARGEAVREVDLELVQYDDVAWWLQAGTMIVIAALYVGAALIALSASPKGKLARTFVKTTLFIALFLL